MTKIDSEVAKELQDYLKESLETDQVRIHVSSHGAELRFPANKSLQAGAAISAFFLNIPDFSPVTEVALNSLIQAQVLADRFNLKHTVMVIDNLLQEGELRGRKITADWEAIREEDDE